MDIRNDQDLCSNVTSLAWVSKPKTFTWNVTVHHASSLLGSQTQRIDLEWLSCGQIANIYHQPVTGFTSVAKNCLTDLISHSILEAQSKLGHFKKLVFGRGEKDKGIRPLGEWCRRGHLFSLAPRGLALKLVSDMQNDSCKDTNRQCGTTNQTWWIGVLSLRCWDDPVRGETYEDGGT